MEATTLEKFLQYLIDDIGGDWLLAGGSLVRLIFDETRGAEESTPPCVNSKKVLLWCNTASSSDDSWK
jgi:hypothetical protein